MAHAILKRLFIVLIAVYSAYPQSEAQVDEAKDTILLTPLIDSLLIDRNKKNWSIRVFANLKEQRFRLSDGDKQISYIPNNPFGVGVGLATKKLIIDIAFNIKNKEEQTQRFDAQGSFNSNGHFIYFFFQNYNGFNVEGSVDNQTIFNTELSSLSSGINYLYIFKNSYPLGALRSVISEQSQSAIMFGLGGFALYLNQKNIGPNLEFSNQDNIINGHIDKFRGGGAGVLLGGSGILPLGKKFYVSMRMQAGVGLMHKYIHSENQIVSDNPLLYQLRANMNIAYVHNKFYLNLIYGIGMYETELTQNIQHIMSQTNAKFVLGYKLFQKTQN